MALQCLCDTCSWPRARKDCFPTSPLPESLPPNPPTVPSRLSKTPPGRGQCEPLLALFSFAAQQTILRSWASAAANAPLA